MIYKEVYKGTGLPKIPVVTQEQALTDLLDSIALQQTTLAALKDAEAEKVQAAAARKNFDPGDTIEFQETV